MKTLILSLILLSYSFLTFGVEGDKIVDATHCKGSDPLLKLCIISSVCSNVIDLKSEEIFYLKLISEKKRVFLFLFKYTPSDFYRKCTRIGVEIEI